jgi:YidC/Oxa1 family membrane protein insertase
MGSDQKRLFLAVLLSGAILLIWQFYFAPRTPQAPLEPTPNPPQEKTPAPISAVSSFSKELKVLKKGESEYDISNDLSLKTVKSPFAKMEFEKVVGEEAPFRIELLEQRAEILKVNFNSVSEGEVKGQVEGKDIQVKMQILENQRLAISLVSTIPHRYRLVFTSKKEELENRRSRGFIYLTKGTERRPVGKDFLDEGYLKWVGIDHHFHLFVFVFPEKVGAKLIGDEKGDMIVDITNPTTDFQGSIVYTQKNYDDLVAMGDNLKLAVDFGVFGILAVPILRGLQFFYKWVPNYGWSIILLTLLIRLITFPLQYKSFKSMKKMQAIQPDLARIKEKYKNDPPKMQKETMELFKKAGANPLGGCLPILIQMPVFFAFYKVLYESVELVKAPFIFWIHDLSQKDPIYVLPILMAGSMFFQQKFTPSTTTDPTQKKIMMFMPIVFGFIMKDLPSGLVLYMFVSTLFGMSQQLMVNKTSS